MSFRFPRASGIKFLVKELMLKESLSCSGWSPHMQDPKAAGITIQVPDLLHPLTSLEIMISEHSVSFSSSLEPLS